MYMYIKKLSYFKSELIHMILNQKYQFLVFKIVVLFFSYSRERHTILSITSISK